MNKLNKILVVFILVYSVYACQKDDFTHSASAKLDYASDTIKFDTIFSKISSTTEHFKVYNRNSKGITISSLYSEKGKDSPFRYNINGLNAYSKNNIDLFSKDSLHLFVEITPKENNLNEPILLEDNIIVSYNGNIDKINVRAWSQDFVLLNKKIIENTELNSDKPYVIEGELLVDTLKVLTLKKGTTFHFKKGASLNIKGTLLINGTYEEPVSFRGYRLEKQYRDVANQWKSVNFLTGSVNNKINYLVLENSYNGLKIDSVIQSDNNHLEMSNTIIKNIYNDAVYAFGAKIKIDNSVIINTRNAAINIDKGGKLSINHSTITSAGSYSSLIFVENKKGFSLNINNSIVYGYNYDEIEINTQNASSELLVTSSLIKSDQYKDSEFFKNCIFNEDPLFIDIYKNNAKIKEDSPVRNKALKQYSVFLPFDLNNIERTIEDNADIGAYEYVKEENELEN